MRYKVRVDDEEFDVEIPNLHTRPVIAIVDGETFEVMLEGSEPRLLDAPAERITARSAPSPVQPDPSPTEVQAQPGQTTDNKVILAPIPGVITSVLVETGRQVNVGDILCMLEAMKMNNAIRSNRVGTIASVFVSVGQHVKHHDVLVEFTD